MQQPKTIKIALVGDRGSSSVAEILQQLSVLSLQPATAQCAAQENIPVGVGKQHNTSSNAAFEVIFTAPQNADIIGLNLFPAQPMESKIAVKERIAATVSVLKNSSAQIVAVCDTAEALAVVSQLENPVVKLASEYGAAADWHLAVTSATLNRVSFVLQGAETAYYRSALATAAKFQAQNMAQALVMLHLAGVAVKELLHRVPKTGLVTEVLAPENSFDCGQTWFFEKSLRAQVLDAVLAELTEVAPAQLVAIAVPGNSDDPETVDTGKGDPQNKEYKLPAQQKNELLRGAYLGHGCSRVYVVLDSGTKHTEVPLCEGLAQARGKAEQIVCESLAEAVARATKECAADTVILVTGQAQSAKTLLTELAADREITG